MIFAVLLLLLLASVNTSTATTGPGQFREVPVVNFTVFEDENYKVTRLMVSAPGTEQDHSEVHLRRSLSDDAATILLKASSTAVIQYRRPGDAIRMLFEGAAHTCQGIGCVTDVRIFELAPTLTGEERKTALARLLVMPFDDTIDASTVASDKIALVTCKVGRDDISVEGGAVSSNYVVGIPAVIVPESQRAAFLQPPQAKNTTAPPLGLFEDTCVMLLKPVARAKDAMGPFGVVHYDRDREVYALCDWKSHRKHWAEPHEIRLCDVQEYEKFKEQRKNLSPGETISSLGEGDFVRLKNFKSKPKDLTEPLKILRCGSHNHWSYHVYNPKTGYSHVAWREDLQRYDGPIPTIDPKDEKRPFELDDLVKIHKGAAESKHKQHYPQWEKGNPYRVVSHLVLNRYQLLSTTTKKLVKMTKEYLEPATNSAPLSEAKSNTAASAFRCLCKSH